MNIDKAVLTFAGCMVLLSAILAYEVNLWWILLTTFVGLNMIQSSFTGFCPAAIIFRKMGLKPGWAFK